MNAHETKGDVESAVSETYHPYATMKPDSGNVDSETLTLPAPATYASARPRKRWSRRFVLCTCCYFFLLLVVSIGITVLLQWLIFQPKDGNYDLRNAHLHTFHLARNGTQSGTQFELDVDMDLEFLFGNPNRRTGFDIKGINVHALYAGEEIGQGSGPDLQPFYLACESNASVGSEIRSVKTVLSETAGGGLQSEIGRNNSVSLLVVMNAKVRNDHMLRALHPYRGVQLACFVNLAAPNGTAPGNLISKSCSVHRGS